MARDKFELEFREDMAYKMGVSVDRIKVTRVMTEEEALAEGDFGDVGGGYDDAFDDGWDVDAGGGVKHTCAPRFLPVLRRCGARGSAPRSLAQHVYSDGDYAQSAFAQVSSRARGSARGARDGCEL